MTSIPSGRCSCLADRRSVEDGGVDGLHDLVQAFAPEHVKLSPRNVGSLAISSQKALSNVYLWVTVLPNLFTMAKLESPAMMKCDVAGSGMGMRLRAGENTSPSSWLDFGKNG